MSSRNLIPASFLRFPSVWDEDDDMVFSQRGSGGLTVSEDSQNIYVDAALPGVEPKDVDITFDKGILWIKGETKEEEKDKKFYKKALNSFSYQISVPGEIDLNKEPEATSKNGMMRVKFTKIPQTQPKKIAVKS